MTPQRWSHLQDLFAAAAGLPAGSRERVLEEGCGDDMELRHNLEALLKAHDEAGSFLEENALSDLAARGAAGGRDPD